MKLSKRQEALLDRLRQVLDGQKGRYKELNGAKSFEDYLQRPATREDEEILTEPALRGGAGPRGRDRAARAGTRHARGIQR